MKNALAPMLLINPPVSRPCEPSAGIARLKAALAVSGVRATVLDANLEGLLHMLQAPTVSDDTWTRRARGAVDRHLADMRSGRAFRSASAYSRAVRDLNRLVDRFSAPFDSRVSFVDYSARNLQPVRSVDLLRAAQHPEDNPFYGYYRLRLPEVLEQCAPSWVGISVTYLSQALCAFALIGCVKQLAPGLRIALGGGLITSWLRRPGVRLDFTGLVDALVEGPGEEQLCRLAGADPAFQHADIVPDYESAELDRYLSPGRIIPYSASQGCYWQQCAFCPERAEGAAYLPFPGATAVQHMGELSQRYSPELLHLLDNAISPALLAQLVQAPPGVPWYGFVRVSRELQDLDFCRALRASGCVMLQLGLESGSDRVLEHMGKGITVQDSSRVLHSLHAAGIATYVYLLFGTPWESEHEAQMTLDFTAGHADAIDFLNVAIFNMPTASAQNAAHDLRSFSDADLSLYTDFVHPAGWDRRSVRRFLDHSFKRHSAIAAILRNKPPLFGSNHAPFLTGKNVDVL
jgi:hypothetical protein